MTIVHGLELVVQKEDMVMMLNHSQELVSRVLETDISCQLL